MSGHALMAWPRPTLLASVLCALVLIRSGLFASPALQWHEGGVCVPGCGRLTRLAPHQRRL